MNAAGFGGFFAGFTAAWAIETLIATTLLLGFVLLVRKPAQRALGTQLAYWLWALPALRMALPPLPAAWREAAALPVASAGETVLVFLTPAAADTAVVEAGFPWLLLIGAAWTIGALLFFVWHGTAHFAYVRRILAPPATRARLSDGTTLVESTEATGPVAFGVLKRFVAVPTDFADRWDADERRLALAHELGHHARGDLVANWIALAVLALHWWNPLAWAAYRKFRADQEMANDARVLAGLPVMERHAYACAIVKAAHGRAITAACHLHTIEDLKGRLRMLKNNRKSRRVLAAGAMGIGALTMVGLGLTASSAAAEKIRTVATTQIEERIDTTTTPPPAVAATARPAPVKRVTVVRDGKTTVYEGADAESYLAETDVSAEVTAALIEARAAIREGTLARVEGRAAAREGRAAARDAWQQRVVIRSKDGKVTRYEGAEADAYYRAHPEMVPPVPPVPPVVVPPVVVRSVTVRPAAPLIATGKDGRMVFRGMNGQKPFHITVPNVVEGNCDPKEGRNVFTEQRGEDKSVTVICRNRIESFATMQAKLGMMQGRMALTQALAGLDTGRRAIEANKAMSDADRSQALAGIASARAEVERELKDMKD